MASAEDQDEDGYSSSSSPVRYLSDYDDRDEDDDDDVPLGAAREQERQRRMQPLRRRTHVRAGSEGYEVRQVQGWQTDWGAVERWEDDPEGQAGTRPWEEEGRYVVYEPHDRDDDGDDWGDG